MRYTTKLTALPSKSDLLDDIRKIWARVRDVLILGFYLLIFLGAFGVYFWLILFRMPTGSF